MQIQDSVGGSNITSVKRPALRTSWSSLTDQSVLAPRKRVSPLAALAARFTVTRRLVGESSFGIVARRFIATEPPDASLPVSYGESFPRFIRRQGSGGSIEYVADIAELEMAWTKARYAPHARPLGAKALARLRSEPFAGLHVRLHPSVCLLRSRFPAVTIFENSRTGNNRRGESGMIYRWRPEAAMAARPFLNVGIHHLAPGGYDFLLSLARGETVEAAADHAAAAHAAFDLASSIAVIERAKVIVDLRGSA